MIYFDYAASTPTDPELIDYMSELSRRIYANPSAAHRLGQDSRLEIEKARELICESLNAYPLEICFTSGGTESNNLAILGYAFSNSGLGKHIISSKLEHKSVLNSLNFLREKFGFMIDFVEQDPNGRVDTDHLKSIIRNDTILISIMHVNNELGTVNDVDEIGRIAREKGIAFHVDAIQSYGKMKIDLKSLPIDLLTASSHKIYGPKAIGLTYIRKGIMHEKVLFGGSQEFDKRAGTENVIGIAGFAKAVEKKYKTMEDEKNQLLSLYHYFKENLQNNFPEARLNGDHEKRIPNIINFSIPSITADKLVMQMDQKEIYISAGSACTSGSRKASHVIDALDLSEEVKHSAVRLSLGKDSTKEELDIFFKNLKDIIEK